VVLADKFWKMFGSQKNSLLFPVLKLCGGVLSTISNVHCGVIEVLALLGCYMAQVGLATNLAGQPIIPILKGQAFQGLVTKTTSLCHVTSQKSNGLKESCPYTCTKSCR
jgi:hypothetical protein